MIGVSTDFKTAIKSEGRQLRAYLKQGITQLTESDDLQSLDIIAEGGLCTTVMREANATHFGTYTFLDTDVNLGIGVVLPDTSVEYIDYGTFKVVEVEQNVGSGVSSIKMYDKMYDAMQRFEITPTYPVTVLELVQAICTELGWTLATTSFVNDSISITSDLFTEPQMSYRDVLNQVAEASGSIIYFDTDDELVIRNISDTVSDTLTVDHMMSLKLEPVYGELNSVVLSRMPQEDNIVDQDSTSIETYGLNELKIINNDIMDGNRETYVTPLFSQLNGLMYYPFEAETMGLAYFEVGDRIKMQDLALNEFEVVVMNIELNMSGGLNERLWADVPEHTTTPYDYAGIIGQTIKNTEIIVNKQEGEIEILNSQMETVATVPTQPTAPDDPEVNDLWLDTDDNVIYIWDGSVWQPTGLTEDDLTNYYTKEETDSQITLTADQINLSVEATQTTGSNAMQLAEDNNEELDSVQSQLTDLELTVGGLDLTVSESGGSNLLVNSTGLKGTVEEWQVFDVDGNLVDVDNDATVIQTTNVIENTESGSGIQIDEQYIVQNISTIVGGSYTFYCRFKKLNDLDMDITGVVDTVSVTIDDYVDETWAIFKYSFEAKETVTTIKISNVDSGVSSYAILSDMVCLLGDINGWVQSPNEVYGNNYRFDKDGFSIASLTDPFKAVLDNTRLGIYDTSSGTDRNIALFSKDEGLITQLIAQDELTIQRYENTNKATRFIATSTGCMITVNN